MDTRSITRVIVIPSYGEDLALPALLSELAPNFTEKDLIIIADDSKPEIRKLLVSRCESAMKESSGILRFSFAEFKSGRGAAVRRGMKIALEECPNLRFVMECDADGSHQPKDILQIMDSSLNCDLLVGSRYLEESQIIGWSITRKIFSKILNIIIPGLFNLQMSDITNGLRKYSISAINLLLSKQANNSGFIYLSEQALLISRNKLIIKEMPITFINRELGTSTVTWREILNSILGIIVLVLSDLSSKFGRK